MFDLSNQVIHSSVFGLLFAKDGGLRAIVVASDFRKTHLTCGTKRISTSAVQLERRILPI